MKRDRTQIVKRVFLEALERRPSERESYLDDTCGHDPTLRQEVESLLDHNRRSASFLAPGVIDITGFPLDQSGHRPTTSLKPGDVIGDFCVESFLACGGVGEVYRANQLSLGQRPVALKVQPLKNFGVHSRERFTREARMTSRVHHPHLVEIYDYGEDLERGLLFYAMRLVEGPTLADLLAKSCNAPADSTHRLELVGWFLQVTRALEALHSKGLVHGDIKPANIVLDSSRPDQRDAIVVDFGLARPVDTAQSRVIATPAYASPEQLAGRSRTPSSDLYSLGLCMVDLLSGCTSHSRPAEDRAAVDLRTIVVDIDRDLAAIVRTCTEPILELRYPSATSLAQDLEAWRNGIPPSVRSLGIRRRMRKWVLTNPIRAYNWFGRIGGTALVIALVAFGSNTLGALLRAGDSVNRAWSDGNLHEVSRALRELPSWSVGIILDPNVRPIADELKSMTGDRAPVAVTRALVEKGEPAAASVAAAFLAKDGLSAHPVIIRFLLHLMNEDSIPRRRERVVEHVARLFFENPLWSKSAIDLAQPLEESLIELLDGGPSIGLQLDVLTALSGCGSVKAYERLVTLLADFEDHNEPVPATTVEEARLTLITLDSIIRRSRVYGTDIASRLKDLPDLAIRVVRRFGLAENTALAQATEDLIIAIAFRERWAGKEPTPISLPKEFWNPEICWVLAAHRDEAQKLRLRRGELKLGTTSAYAYGRIHDYGRSTAFYDDSELENACRSQVLSMGRDHGLDSDAVVKTFDLGVASGHDELKGIRNAILPDEGTRLIDTLSRPLSPVEVKYAPLSPNDPAESLCRFIGPSVRASSEVAEITLEQARLAVGEPSSTVSHVWLGLPGRSEVQVRTHLQAPPDSDLQIHIRLQKALRSPLRDLGECRVDLLLNGESLAEAQLVTNDTDRLIHFIPLAQIRDELPHEISVRLNDRSNTTLWIYGFDLVALPKTRPR